MGRSWPMRTYPQFKILRTVVLGVPVHVVDRLFWLERPAEHLFHYDTMLEPVFARGDEDTYTSLSVGVAAANLAGR
jgi:hypothetical protein